MLLTPLSDCQIAFGQNFVSILKKKNHNILFFVKNFTMEPSPSFAITVSFCYK